MKTAMADDRTPKMPFSAQYQGVFLRVDAPHQSHSGRKEESQHEPNGKNGGDRDNDLCEHRGGDHLRRENTKHNVNAENGCAGNRGI